MGQADWTGYLEELFTKNDLEVMQALREKNVQSFIMRRYFPAKLFARMVFGNKPVAILDVGCSLNLGLQAVSIDDTGELFPGLKVGEISPDLYAGKVTIAKGLGIDLHEPNIDWVASCIWPDHEDEKSLIRKAYADLHGKNRAIQFKKLSALELDQQVELIGQFDLVIASGMLYQLSVADERRFLRQVSAVAKPGAWFLTTDYPRGISYKEDLSYLTQAYPITDQLGEPKEFVKADDPFTTIVKPGKDFQSFVSN